MPTKGPTDHGSDRTDYLDVEMHTINMSTWEASEGRWILEFGANLVYRASSRTARVKSCLGKAKIKQIFNSKYSLIKITTLLAFISKTEWAIKFN